MNIRCVFADFVCRLCPKTACVEMTALSQVMRVVCNVRSQACESSARPKGEFEDAAARRFIVPQPASSAQITPEKPRECA